MVSNLRQSHRVRAPVWCRYILSVFFGDQSGRVIILPIAKPLMEHITALPADDSPRALLHPRAHAHLQNSAGRPATLSRQFHDILAQAGRAEKCDHSRASAGRASQRKASEISFHSLRHTATSLMKNAGMSPAVVQDIIGHDSAAMSAHYTHIEHDAKLKALNSMPDVTQQVLSSAYDVQDHTRRRTRQIDDGRLLQLEVQSAGIPRGKGGTYLYPGCF